MLDWYDETDAEDPIIRFAVTGIQTRFYTLAFHRASFALPRPIAELLD